MENSDSPKNVEPTGRNEPCPCGSRKKYKRCHGADAAPKLTTPAKPANLPPGFDPSQFNPEMVKQLSQMMKQLPKGQVQRLQSMFQRAMSGEDISKDAALLEQTLPPQFMEKMQGFQSQYGSDIEKMTGMPAQPDASTAPTGQMTEEDARKIVAQAAESGKIDPNKAQELLAAPSAEKNSKFSKLWKSFKKS